MSNDDKPSAPKSNRSRKGPVILDYRGYIGRGTRDKGGLRDDRAILHRLSPLVAMWPENGQADLQLQPGLNLVDGELWHFYTEVAKGADGSPGMPQIMEKVRKGYIRELDALPPDPGTIHDLIKRSMSREGLEWIAKQEERGEGRQDILDAVADRLTKIRPVQLRAMTFQRHVPAIKTGEAQPSLAMG